MCWISYHDDDDAGARCKNVVWGSFTGSSSRLNVNVEVMRYDRNSYLASFKISRMFPFLWRRTFQALNWWSPYPLDLHGLGVSSHASSSPHANSIDMTWLVCILRSPHFFSCIWWTTSSGLRILSLNLPFMLHSDRSSISFICRVNFRDRVCFPLSPVRSLLPCVLHMETRYTGAVWIHSLDCVLNPRDIHPQTPDGD